MGGHKRKYFMDEHTEDEAKGIIRDILIDIRDGYGPDVYVGTSAVSDKFPRKTGNYHLTPIELEEFMGEMMGEDRIERVFALREYYRKEPSKVPLYRMKLD